MLLQRKKESATRKVKVADTVGSARRNSGGIVFDAKQKVRADEDSAQGRFDAALEVFVGARLSIELQRLFQVGLRNRPAVSPAHEAGQDFFRGILFVLAASPVWRRRFCDDWECRRDLWRRYGPLMEI